MENNKCEFCKKVGDIYDDNLCQKCYDKLAEWDIVEINKKLVEFNKLKTKDSLNFLKKEIRSYMLMMYELKNYLVDSKVIDNEDFKEYCLGSKKNLLGVNIGLIILDKNKEILDYYKNNPIIEVEVITSLTNENLNKMNDKKLIFVLSDDNPDFLIKQLPTESVKVLVCKKETKNTLFNSQFICDERFEKVYECLRNLIETMTKPEIMPLSSDDLSKFFQKNRKTIMEEYTSSIKQKDKLLKNVGNINNGYLIMIVGPDMKFDDILSLEKSMYKVTKELVTAVRIQNDMYEKITLQIFHDD